MSLLKRLNPNGESPSRPSRDKYTLKGNSRPYSQEEEKAENNAIGLTKLRFKRIPPIAGTLGYLLRNFDNRIVMNYVKNCYESGGKAKPILIRRVIDLFEKLDESSQSRVDVFDYICREFGVSNSIFWGWFQAGAYEDMEAIMQTAIIESTPEVFATIAINAQNPDVKYDKSRELWAKITGRLKDAGFNVNIDQTKTTINNNAGSQNLFGNFTSSIRNAEIPSSANFGNSLQSGSGEEEFAQKILTEGNAEFVDAEIITNEEQKEKVITERL